MYSIFISDILEYLDYKKANHIKLFDISKG